MYKQLYKTTNAVLCLSLPIRKAYERDNAAVFMFTDRNITIYIFIILFVTILSFVCNCSKV